VAFKGPARPSPAVGDALKAGNHYLEVKRLGCDTHQTVALDIVHGPNTTPAHQLERYMRCAVNAFVAIRIKRLHPSQ
jgi:hypothetical protein